MTRLECKVGERLFQIYCEVDSPISDFKEALFQFQKYAGAVEDAIKRAQEAQNVEASVPKEPPKEENIV